MMVDEPLTVRRLRASDAASLSECFRRCYGNTYPAEIFYDVEKLTETIGSGQLRSVVAVTVTDQVVGHTGLTIRHPEARAIEAGNTIVDPDYRGHGLLGRLGAALTELCTRAGYIGYVHYPTTAHEIMQKRSVSGSGVETGVMLGYVPAETEYRAVDRRSGRLAATVVYQPMADGDDQSDAHDASLTALAPSRILNLPERYRPLLKRLITSTGLPRQFQQHEPVHRPVSDIRDQMYPRRQLLHLYLQRSGGDLLDRVRRLLSQHQPEITHMDLPLDDQDIDLSVNTLVKLGFHFCALLPEFSHTDLLRMQWLASEDPQLYAPTLANPGARALLDQINADR